LAHAVIEQTEEVVMRTARYRLSMNRRPLARTVIPGVRVAAMNSPVRGLNRGAFSSNRSVATQVPTHEPSNRPHLVTSPFFQPANGSSSFTPVGAKCLMLCVTRTRS
jgi:hypothetical protein